MNLYLITQDKVTGYDTYDSAVVVADSANEAANTHPYGGTLTHYCNGRTRHLPNDDWADSVDDITVKFLGQAQDNLEKGPICASFHAG